MSTGVFFKIQLRLNKLDLLATAQYHKCVCLPQIQKVVLALGDYMGASCHACIGGTNVRNDVQKLQADVPQIVVGTPGRVFDMLNRRYLCKCEWQSLVSVDCLI